MFTLELQFTINSQGWMVEGLLPNDQLSACSLRTAPSMRVVTVLGGQGHISAHSLTTQRSFVNYCHSLCWLGKVIDSQKRFLDVSRPRSTDTSASNDARI